MTRHWSSVLLLALASCGGGSPARSSLVVEIAEPKAAASPKPPEEAEREEAPALARFAGTYDGELMEVEHMVSVRTKLSLEGKSLEGQYFYGDRDEEGTLDECEVIAEHVLSCTWHDAYGTGPLVMHFDPLIRGFEGTWASDARPEEHLPWNGQRQGTPVE